MFLGELQKMLEEDKDNHDETKFTELLKKSEYIINRIMSKAATPYGSVVRSIGNAQGRSTSNGPIARSSVIHNICESGAVSARQPTIYGKENKPSWHFDVSNRTLAAKSNETTD